MAALPPASRSSFAIIGSGLVGKSWAVIFAREGNHVNLFDSVPDRAKLAKRELSEQLKLYEKGGILNGRTSEQILDLVHPVDSLREALQNAIYVQECTPEVLNLKQMVFKEIDSLIEDGVPVCSSTSNLMPSLFTEGLKHASQMLVAHPINPPHIIPSVEVVPSPWTSPEVVAQVSDILKSVKQLPIILKKEVDGFLVNRLQFALLGEAFRLVQDGIADASDIDRAISHGLGHRWAFLGPFQTIDLNAPGGLKDYCARYMGGVERILKTQDNTREPWNSPETVDSVAKDLRREVPIESLSQQTAWRDQCLMDLYKLKKAHE